MGGSIEVQHVQILRTDEGQHTGLAVRNDEVTWIQRARNDEGQHVTRSHNNGGALLKLATEEIGSAVSKHISAASAMDAAICAAFGELKADENVEEGMRQAKAALMEQMKAAFTQQPVDMGAIKQLKEAQTILNEMSLAEQTNAVEKAKVKLNAGREVYQQAEEVYNKDLEMSKHLVMDVIEAASKVYQEAAKCSASVSGHELEESKTRSLMSAIDGEAESRQASVKANVEMLRESEAVSRNNTRLLRQAETQQTLAFEHQLSDKAKERELMTAVEEKNIQARMKQRSQLLKQQRDSEYALETSRLSAYMRGQQQQMQQRVYVGAATAGRGVSVAAQQHHQVMVQQQQRGPLVTAQRQLQQQPAWVAQQQPALVARRQPPVLQQPPSAALPLQAPPIGSNCAQPQVQAHTTQSGGGASVNINLNPQGLLAPAPAPQKPGMWAGLLQGAADAVLNRDAG